MNNTNPTISIIIPVYNTEEFLPQCLDSVLSQSFTDWEMLLVDDGSTDNSGRICNAYANEYPRINVFHQPHRGQSYARNFALDISRGKYICMVDADDVLLSEDFLDILFNSLKSNSACMSSCSSIDFWDDLPPAPVRYESITPICMSGREYSSIQAAVNGCRYGSAWGKLIDRALFENVRYPIDRIAEDHSIAHELIYPCKRIVLIPDKLYGYRKHETSTMRTIDRDSLFQDTIIAFDERKRYFQQKQEPELAQLTDIRLMNILRFYKKHWDKR